MTQFKDKAGKNREAASVGLYGYPVLQAADILVYLATHVPVGEDQKQHLELTRDIAGKFNNDFGVDFFPLIEPLIMGAAARIMSLRDGSKKMSKSEPSDMSRINLHDDADAIANKIRRAKTDPQALPGAEVLDADGAITDAFAKERPEAANLVTIYAALGRESLSDVLNELAGKSFSDFKGLLTERAVDQMAPIGSEMQRLMNDPAHIDAVLKDGAERARAIAGPVIDQVYDIVGLLRA
jgi:tryptophanyl-tRNA synthetase